MGIIALGAALRLYNLDFKPLWLDEVLTALLSLGRRYTDVPLDMVFPLSRLEPLFTLQPNLSCLDIGRSVATQSTHPPLFFCLMHEWLKWTEPLAQPLSWKLRALPALLGVGAIAAMYSLNRSAFSPTAGLMGAALMAVSPFAVYLSQEARHYTLPVLLITLALLGLIQIQHEIYSRHRLPRLRVWVLWGMINSIGCYVHYFFILAFIAQILTLIGLMYWHRWMLPKGSWLAVSLVVFGVVVSYLPWLPVLLGDYGRSETGWLPGPQHIAPLYQTLAGWLIMVIAVPIEGQPLWIKVPSALLMIGFGIWVVQQSFRGLKRLWQQPSTHIATFTLLGFTFCVLLQFVAIIYLLGKDITVAPRYNFVYYPAVCALLGASLTTKRNWIEIFFKNAFKRHSSLLVVLVGILSCVFVVYNLAFQKPFNPQQVAQTINSNSTIPLLTVMAYNNFQDVALGLSFALALEQSRDTGNASFVFLDQERSHPLIWQKLSQLSVQSAPNFNVWIVAPGLRRRDYPQQLTVGQMSCTRDPKQFHRIGIPYQLYQCQ